MLNSDTLYKPTDYHWLLLYECLRSYCDYFNDERIGDLYKLHQIESIDFGGLIECYFWDTDFLNDDIPNVSLEVRQMMGVSSETFGLTAGMKPHPDELTLAVCNVEMVDEFKEHRDTIFIPGSKLYPIFLGSPGKLASAQNGGHVRCNHRPTAKPVLPPSRPKSCLKMRHDCTSSTTTGRCAKTSSTHRGDALAVGKRVTWSITRRLVEVESGVRKRGHTMAHCFKSWY